MQSQIRNRHPRFSRLARLPGRFRTTLAAAAAVACGLAAATGATPARAQDGYPARPVTMVVPAPPGGITDQLARLVASHMARDFGIQVVIDNRGGAGGNIAAEIGARAQPDGYTVLMGTQGMVAGNQFLYKSLRFDPEKDFVAAQGLVTIPNILVVNSQLPFRSVRDLVTYARANPGKLTVASVGNGTGTHLAAELFQAQAGVKFVHIPYKGSAPVINDLLAGQVDMTFDYPVSTLPQIQAGKLRALAVTGKARLPALAQVPTVAEAGYPGAEATSWIGLFFPARTSAAVVARWQADIGRLLADPAVIAEIQRMGAAPLPLGGERFHSFVASERGKWKAIIQRSGASID
ncbi:Bug family tripartite tricarboxylate transporter substrate binding protein [Cupriavidus oxalaticus]|jgi:tripartite-type tricarboxylate transporter receptor subunit TctC|uniref:Tripartite tricarboxylate transporter substrate binding protein n=1 Tax=Cupriavidus oxalaticus TaxID=96344 RepID=A0ABX7HPY1_9BURK|nr:tripartite tricarboxylate transporter substrate binding protein [Cupriavidus oxalaticus]QRQ83484.1 tripartite tricarboxylate transporter substrate binding protein [Cupriavidus oxalaticus]QRQ92427.1 tripartite tricarboxylate transporter substrate binding protein [Cupriavidus oxalaticus]WQD87045.1 tripartite tricarboxylate transporter substrate binding protein [Cupriavidus oxalaticus]